MGNELANRTLYIPEMDYGGTRFLAACFRHAGVDAHPVPHSTGESLKKGFACTSGEECFPQQITIGDFLHILDEKLSPPEKTAFFMPTATGPCRFGQYATLTKNVLKVRGYDSALVYSLTSEDGYAGVGGMSFVRRVFWGIVMSDLLRKSLHKVRPYEKKEGVADEVYKSAVSEGMSLVASDIPTGKELFKKLISFLKRTRNNFESIEKYDFDYPLIGVVGEIFCRLNTFSNGDLIRHLEKMGAEVWLSGVSEWILYTMVGERTRLVEEGHKYSKKMLAAVIKDKLIKHDEHRLSHVFRTLLKGREEETKIERLLKNSEPYLPSRGALGEMTLNAANAIHLYHKGASGIIDISPFACMNGIVSEAAYPRISRDCDGMPIRIFYFDGTQTHLDRDLGIFLELARNYKKRNSKSNYPT